ncbi:hypothetical protein AWB76_06539 [Caballeronia temeraria]|uniref:Uncharacterized protein n=1 Tax=Caballeronia temeraria TaxID=1777137 RepID=A0A158D7H4_9BURK|nr:hypothetical protein AWB76_06539 [Caballeronia temeraria]
MVDANVHCQLATACGNGLRNRDEGIGTDLKGILTQQLQYVPFVKVKGLTYFGGFHVR